MTCAAGSEQCPSGLVCGADNLCKESGAFDCSQQIPDANGDGPIVIGDGALCFGDGLLKICLDAVPPSRTFSTNQVLDTNVTGTCDLIVQQSAGNADLCVITGSTIDVTAQVTLVGNRSPIFLATDRLTIAVGGTLSVASLRGMAAGANANDGACAPRATTSGMNGISGAAGGAGGSFATRGGTGGTGAGGSTLGGVSGQAQTLTQLRGGCFAGNGGDGNRNTGGPGGDSGGAIYLIAGTTLHISGTVNASGAGGTGGPNGAGGGGGGSGGTIGLDANLVVIDMGARVFALGGGGGAGGGQGLTGPNGTEPTAPGTFGQGGPGVPGNSGDGGDGSDPLTPDPGITAGSGAGGGGGGTGFVKVFSTMAADIAAGTVAPPPS